MSLLSPFDIVLSYNPSRIEGDRHQTLQWDWDVRKIADSHHSWRGDKDSKGQDEDVPGFCKAATLEEIRNHGHVLTPGRYVGAEPIDDDDEPFEEKMKRLTKTLKKQYFEAARLDQPIWANLKEPGYGTEDQP